jgi:hypothetical protein
MFSWHYSYLAKNSIKSSLFFCWLNLAVILVARNVSDENATSNYPEVKTLGSGIYDFGGITIDQKNRSFSFDAVCNQTSRLVEYALVHENGKIHESLFRTKINPKWIHACFLLLKESPFVTAQKEQGLAVNNSRSARTRAISILVEWDGNGTQFLEPLAQMTVKQTNQKTLDEGSFLFTGSKVIEGDYLAEMDGSIIAIYEDSRATINAIDEDNTNDDIWLANGQNMPPLEKKVRIHLKLPSPKIIK